MMWGSQHAHFALISNNLIACIKHEGWNMKYGNVQLVKKENFIISAFDWCLHLTPR